MSTLNIWNTWRKSSFAIFCDVLATFSHCQLDSIYSSFTLKLQSLQVWSSQKLWKVGPPVIFWSWTKLMTAFDEKLCSGIYPPAPSALILFEVIMSTIIVRHWLWIGIRWWWTLTYPDCKNGGKNKDAGGSRFKGGHNCLQSRCLPEFPVVGSSAWQTVLSLRSKYD